LAAAIGLITLLAADDPASDAIETPPYEDFVVVPLRVHVLTADDLPDVDCKLSDADITRIIGKVNRIWNKAGIHFGLESIVREPAAEQAKFRLALKLDRRAPLELHRILLPSRSRRFQGLHAYYIHDFAVNGVHLERDVALVKETARLRPVEGGLDEPIPRVTSHELGHALGLPHREDRTNLLASGTTGIRLNVAEKWQAREAARRLPGTRTVPELRLAADEAVKKKQTARARQLWLWLSQIPGADADLAKQRLDALETYGEKAGH
jgi:hypothetical protein